MEFFLTDLLQYTIEGALKGTLYAVVALAFIVIYRAGRILNFAQGEIVIVGAFIIWTFTSLANFPVWLALVLSFLASILLGLVVERVLFRPLVGQPVWAILMVTIGLMILLQGLTLIIWGGQERPFPLIFSRDPVKLGQLVFSRSIFLGGIISLLVFLAVSWIFERTRWGLKLTAVAEDHRDALSMGISVKKSIATAWIIGCLLSTYAAIILLDGKILALSAAAIGLQALPVVLLAGLESIWGALLAGLIVGIGTSWAAAYLDPYTDGAMSEAFPYLLMLLALIIRPQGLFGWKIIERV
jgi:branched-chain amino acid transport system permease protein